MSSVDFSPHLYDLEDFFGRHICQGEVVSPAEGQDIAFTRLWLGAQEPVCCRLGRVRRHIRFRVERLLFFGDGGKVVDEDESVLVLWVLSTVGADVAWTEVAFGVVGWEVSGGGRFLLALPGTFSAVGRDEDPTAAKGIVAAVRDVVEDLVGHFWACDMDSNRGV